MIYWHSLRDFPYSKEEETVGQRLISLYYNFAKYSKAVYDEVALKPATPENIHALEIGSQAKMVTLDESFGNVGFWDDIEKTLHAEEKTYYDEL